MSVKKKWIAIVLIFGFLVTLVSLPAHATPGNVRVTNTNFVTASAFGYGSTVGGPDDVLQQNEPSVAVSPVNSNKIAVGVNDVRSLPQTGDAWQGLAFSTDGGVTWTESLVPGFPGDSSTPVLGYGAASDPYVAFDRENHLYFAFVAFNRRGNPSAVAVARYDASGSSAVYEKTVVVATGSFGLSGKSEDKEALAVDVGASSPFKNNVYVSWTTFTGLIGHLYFASSTDKGETYSRPIKLDAGTTGIQGSSIAVAPNGTLYVAYRKGDLNPPPGTPQENAIYVVSSTDGGATFSRPIRVQFMTPYTQLASQDPAVFRVDSFPWIAADANGVYVAWSNLNPVSGADIEISRSKDGGRSWEQAVIPHSVSSTLGKSGNGHQIMPSMAAAGGELSVVWYDSRSEPAFTATGPVSGSGFGATGIGMDVYYAQADTAAAGPLSFAAPIRVTSQSFNPNLDASILAHTPFIGDYIFVAATSNKAYVVWADNRDINDAAGINGALYQGDTLPCPAPCPSLAPSLVNQRAVDSNVYFEALTK